MNFDDNSWDLEDILGSDGEDDEILEKVKEEEEDSVPESPSAFTLQPIAKNSDKKKPKKKPDEIPIQIPSPSKESDDELLNLFEDSEPEDAATPVKSEKSKKLSSFVQQNFAVSKQDEQKPKLASRPSTLRTDRLKQTFKLDTEIKKENSLKSSPKRSNRKHISPIQNKPEPPRSPRHPHRESQSEATLKAKLNLKDAEIESLKDQVKSLELQLEMKENEKLAAHTASDDLRQLQFNQKIENFKKEHELELFKKVEETKNMKQKIIDDLKKKHSEEVRSLRELNRNKKDSFSAADALVHPLTEKLEFCCNRLNSMQSEFIELLQQTNGDRVEWLSQETSALKKRELQLDTKQENLVKLQREIEQALEALRLEKIELRAVEENIRSQEKLSRAEFLSCQQSIRAEREQLLEEKLRLQDKESSWIEQKQKGETTLQSRKTEADEILQSATITRERAEKELFKAKTEYAIVQEQRRKLQADMEAFKDEQSLFKSEHARFEIESVDMKKKYEEAKQILKDSNARKEKLEQLEDNILKENEMLKVRRQRFESERKTFERDMVDVLSRENHWSGSDVGVSDRARRIPRETGHLPTFSLPCGPTDFDLSSELESLRATTAESKRFLKNVKLKR